MKKHRTLIIGIGIVLGVGWFILMLYALSAERAPQTEVNPGAIAAASVKQFPDETLLPMPTVKMPRVAAPSHIQHHVVQTTATDDAPKATMHSTSMHLRQTSDAKVHSIGGGTANTNIGAAVSSGKSSKGASYSGLGFGGNMFMMSSSLALATPGALQANELTDVEGPKGKNGMVKTTGLPEEPFRDPIGDIAWGLMLLLAAAYVTMLGVRRFRREEK